MADCFANPPYSVTTAMDGGSVAIGREPMRPTAMDGGSAGAAGSGSSKNLEGLIGNVHALQLLRFSLLEMHVFDADSAGNADQDIGVIDEQAGQCAGIMFNCIA
jgi:hypothetical protein